MVLFSQPPAATAAQPTTSGHVVVNQAPPVTMVNQQGGCGCDCSVPPNTHPAVKGTRWCSIAVIVTHTLALLIFGYYLWEQWIASLMGIIMGSTLLCNFNRCCYITASVLYSIAALFDFIAAIIWLAWGFGVVALPAFLAAIASIIGAIYGCIATCNWGESGAPDVMVAVHGPVQVARPTAVPSTNATTVQPNYTYPVPSKGPPPPYGV